MTLSNDALRAYFTAEQQRLGRYRVFAEAVGELLGARQRFSRRALEQAATAAIEQAARRPDLGQVDREAIADFLAELRADNGQPVRLLGYAEASGHAVAQRVYADAADGWSYCCKRAKRSRMLSPGELFRDRMMLADALPDPDELRVLLEQEAALARKALREMQPSKSDGRDPEASREELPKIRAKPGRPSDTDPAADRRIADGWRASGCATYAEYARLCGVPEREVKLAIGRHRKREEKAAG